MAPFLRAFTILIGFVCTSNVGRAADQKSIDAAIEKGKTFLKARFGGQHGGAGSGNYGIGPVALAGVALLEARVPADDPAIKTITAAVREAAYSESKTYQLALCITYLDHLEDPADVPLIQVLTLRLLTGQTTAGGWGYNCVEPVPADHVRWLKANLKLEPPAKENIAPKSVPRLHPDVVEYSRSISRPSMSGPALDDNSNTQFAIIGLWQARKHGVPVEAALDLIEKRFRATQDPQIHGWSYFGNPGAPSTPGMTTASMTCAGLLGLAIGNARRIEKKPKTDGLKDPQLKTPAVKPDGPFFSNPTKPTKGTEPNARALNDPAVQRAIQALGSALTSFQQNGGILSPSEKHGDRDLYLLWSVERVGVIFGLEKLGNFAWYEVGADAIVRSQQQDGSWGGGYGSDVNTSFALLFLCKADLLRDLSNKFRNAKDNELRAGTSGGTPAGGGNTGGTPMPKDIGSTSGTPALPSPVEDGSTKLARELILAPATDWTSALEKLRDAKGTEHTRGLVIAIHRLDGNRKRDARAALAERLTRMSAETLRGMMTADDAELRRGATLAAAMKDDKAHISDLIARIADEDDLVVRAARAGLASLTSQDFGPKPGASSAERQAAIAAWTAWLAKQK